MSAPHMRGVQRGRSVIAAFSRAFNGSREIAPGWNHRSMDAAVVVEVPAGHDEALLRKLVEAAAGGDQEAIAQVYDLTCVPVLRLIRDVVDDPTVSDEALQATYLEIWRRAQEGASTRGSVIGWISEIAYAESVGRRAPGAWRPLPDEQRRCLALAHYFGLSQVEIASVTGTTLAIVRALTRAALTNIRCESGPERIADLAS